MISVWLSLIQHLQAIAQTGLEYARDPYDLERYRDVTRTAAAMMSIVADVDATTMERVFAEETGYATPKIDVRGAVFEDGRILLVKERADGLWTLPGGWADVGESPRESIEREVEEESGFVVRAVKLAAIYDRNKHPHTPRIFHVYKMFFVCELRAGRAQSSRETSEVAFFDEHSLPELSVDRVLPFQIFEMFAHMRNPARHTCFD